MRFLLDNNLSPKLAELLRAAGHDVVHVRDIGMASATDSVVIDEARAQGRVLISADTDFGTLLARTHATTPSFCSCGGPADDAPEQAAIILSNLNVVQADLDAGAIVVLGEATLRIRRLPIGALARADNRRYRAVRHRGAFADRVVIEQAARLSIGAPNRRTRTAT